MAKAARNSLAADLGRAFLEAASSGSFVERYSNAPDRWAQECISWRPGEALAPYQLEVLSKLPGKGRVAVRGPHGLGKTAIDALAVWWFATTRDAAGLDWKVVTTAGGWRHLTKYLWPEIGKWARRIRWDVVGRPAPRVGVELLDLSFKGRTGMAFAVASTDAKLIEGAHADEILYLLDESKAIADPTWNAVEGALASGHALALTTSTPELSTGRFYEIHARKKGLEDWWPRHVTLEEAIAAGRISRAWADQRLIQWGEKSPIYQNRVLGNFSSSDAERAVIPLAWIEEAVERWKEWQAAGAKLTNLQTAVGVDVGDGGDESVMAPRFDHILSELLVYPKGDTMKTTGRVVVLMKRGGNAIPDSIGIGAGVVSRLRELGIKTIPFNAACGSDRTDRSGELRFANLRAEAWWGMREQLDPTYNPIACIPDDDILVGELAAPTWSQLSNGRILVESKKDIRARLGRSTNRADAVIQAFWAGATPVDTRVEAPSIWSAPRRRSF